MAGKRTSGKAESHRVFGQQPKPARVFRGGFYARVHARPIAVIESVNDEEIGACRRRRPTQVRSRGGLFRFVTYDIDLATKSRDIIGAQDFLQNAECDGANS